MRTIVLFGAGKIGEAIVALLSTSGRYRIRVADARLEAATLLAQRWSNAEPHQLELENRAAALAILNGADAVISALPYHCNRTVATLAKEAALHYFDLTEDVRTTREVRALAEDAHSVFMPQCGLAPGFISIAAAHLVSRMQQVDSVKMRVGALPIYPSNQLKYNLTWSTEGLINEYGNPCDAIVDGRKAEVLPLEGYERFSLDGVEYEAFNTSGGLGTLRESLLGKVRELNYKSVRYPGHHELITFLMNELKFNSHREQLREVLERSVPTTAQDKCVIFVEAKGMSDGRYVQRTYASTIYHGMLAGKRFGAIQLTTAAGVLAPLDLLLEGKLGERRGMVRCEEIPLPLFLANEFGKYYQDEAAMRDLES